MGEILQARFFVGGKMELWKCLPSEAVVKLVEYQWRHYNLRLELLSGKEPDVSVRAQLEGSDEIIKLMSQKPRGTHRA